MHARTRSTRTSVGLGIGLATAALLVLSAAPADARATVTRTYTARVVASVSKHAVEAQKVSATAVWSGVKITMTGTARTERRATATRSATVTVRRSAASKRAARAAAKRAAKAAAARAAKAAAKSAAAVSATTAARRALPRAVATTYASLQAKALASAKDAAANGGPTGVTGSPVDGTPGGTSSGSGGNQSGDSPCGPTTYKADGTPWVCTFDDEFNGDTLDPTKWTAWDDVNWWGQSNICYYDDPSHVSVSGGALHLSVTKMDPSASCWTATDGTAPTYGGAVVHTKDNFAQSYGQFEARIKFGGGMGIHNAFWLWPQQNSYGGHSEIDIAEPFGTLPNNVIGAVHMTDNEGQDGGTTNYCDVANWADAYHVYGLDWTPAAITFLVDGKRCGTYANWHQMTGFASTAPFGQDFFMILEASADNGVYSPAPDDSTQFPATTTVDWVRVWK